MVCSILYAAALVCMEAISASKDKGIDQEVGSIQHSETNINHQLGNMLSKLEELLGILDYLVQLLNVLVVESLDNGNLSINELQAVVGKLTKVLKSLPEVRQLKPRKNNHQTSNKPYEDKSDQLLDVEEFLPSDQGEEFTLSSAFNAIAQETSRLHNESPAKETPRAKTTKRPWMSVGPMFPSHDNAPKLQHFFSVWKSQMKLFPFSNVVYLSATCSGVLLSPMFVLTLASCITNSNKNIPIYGMEMDGTILRRNSADLYIPDKYNSRDAREKYENDYAVLKLDRTILNKPYARLVIMSTKYITSMEHSYEFVGYYKKSHRQPAMLYTECSSESLRPVGGSSLVLAGCSVLGGMQGGPAYVLPPNDEYRIFGLLKDASGIILFTKAMVEDICVKTVEMGEVQSCKGL